MATPRFYCPAWQPAPSLTLPAEAAHHAVRVLRLGEGNAVEVFDGAGHAARGVLTGIAGKQVGVGKLVALPDTPSPPLQITLAQAISSAEKMDWIVQKAVELGVSRIVPLVTERSIAKLDAARAAKRLQHWQQVAISACEQCGQNRLPQIDLPMPLASWLGDTSCTTRLMLHPYQSHPMTSLSLIQGSVAILIGPEGGLSDREVQAARAAGYQPVLLGPRILRMETAALAALTALQTLWGDFNP